MPCAFEEEDELNEVDDVTGDEPHKRMLMPAAAASDDEDELLDEELGRVYRQLVSLKK